MTQEEFIEVLDGEGYSYEIEGDKIGVTHRGDVYLKSLTSLPPGVKFINRRHVNLSALTSLSPGVEFKNGGDVYLTALTSLPPGVVFMNRGDVYLGSLVALVAGYFHKWKGNIEGIDNKRLLNLMIGKGMFI